MSSGHSSNAFALATCFERHYGWKVSLPAYLLASAVAASRLQRNAHFSATWWAGRPSATSWGARSPG